MTASVGLPLPKAFKSELFPIDRFDPGEEIIAFLSKILVTSYTEELYDPLPGGSIEVGLTIADELVINMIGLDGFALAMGGASHTSLVLGAEMRPDELKIKIAGGIRLRFPRNILKPVIAEGDEWIDDPSRPFAELEIMAGVIIDQDWNVSFDGANAFTLQPAMVADSGFVLEGEVALDLSETTGLPESAALGLPPSWRGVVFRNLTVHLPKTITDAVPIASVGFENFHIGSGGVSGKIELTGAAGSGALAGFPFTPTTFAIELVQNALIGAELAGTIELPFFDAPVEVEVGFDLAGNIHIGIAAADGSALKTLDKPGLLSMSLESLGFSRTEDNLFAVELGGSITPKVAGLDWPTFRIEKLSIDTAGHVKLEGGWMDLREQYVLNLSGFQLSISRIGFGTETDGRRWIGFNGGLKLVDGLSAGASVEGLRVRWSPTTPFNPSLSLEGVGVEFEIPGTLSFKGFVAMREPEPGSFRFDGDLELKLIAIGLEVDGQLVVGYNKPEDFTYFAIYVGVELPAGIPLWTTGLGLYGLAGLFALNMEPGRLPDEPWYAIQPGPSDWYHRDPPGVGVAELRKWDDAEGSLGFGAGITIGTVVDNGFTFAGKMLFAIVFPGPILLIEGAANVLKERSSLGDEPVFRTLLVLDGRERTLLAGLDARYTIADAGELIDIGGSVELFFDFDDPLAWHLYLGIDEPRERRIGADIFFHIFRTESYFMIDANRLRTGAWTGIDKHWSFGPLSVSIQAWMDGRADLSFKPVYFQGSLTLHGGVEVSVFGFGFGLSVTAAVAAGVFDPFYIRADLSVTVNLPWPFPDFDVSFTLEWGPEADPPLLPMTVKEVAIAHEKVTTTWPLPADSLLLPQIDKGSSVAGFFDNQPPALPNIDMAPPPANLLPVVPMDARPDVTFGRTVHDDALVGSNAQPAYPSANPVGWIWVGNPGDNSGPVRVRPKLAEIAIDRWNGASWGPVARSATDANPAGVPRLYGSWMPTPDDPGAPAAPALGNVKLRVWAKTPFTFTRHTGGEWDQWIGDNYPGYPCIDLPKDRMVCCDFADLPQGAQPTPPWSCAKNDVFSLTWAGLPKPAVAAHTIDGVIVNGLCFPTGKTPIVVLKKNAKRVLIDVYAEPFHSDDRCVDFRDRRGSRATKPRSENGYSFTTYRDGGALAATSNIVVTSLADGSTLSGLSIDSQTNIELPAPASAVTLTLSTKAPPISIYAYDKGGNVLATDQVTHKNEVTVITLSAPSDRSIARVTLQSKQPGTGYLHVVCAETKGIRSVWADTYDDAAKRIDRFWQKGNTIEIDARNVSTIVIGRDFGRFCILRICVVLGLSAADQIALNQLSQHIVDELARWQSDGDVLPPYSTFRLKIATGLDVVVPGGSKVPSGFSGMRPIAQVAYFRTEGPPGLANLTASGNALVPGAGTGGTAPPTVETGLEDLSRYVAQTIPPTVPPPGQPPLLPRPVYRGYDVGVKFNENYVDELYALAGRDLSMALYDNNDQPIRDDKGRLVIPANLWGRSDTLDLTQSEQNWLEILSKAKCTGTVIDLGTIAHNKTVGLEGFVLDPETVYEARLLPMLLHETFDGYPLAATASGSGATLVGSNPVSWKVLDFGSVDGPSVWRVDEAGIPVARFIEQNANVSHGAASRNFPFPGGTFLYADNSSQLAAGDPDQPANWTDYRLSAYVRSIDDDIVGIALRVSGQRGYLVKLDRQRGKHQLVLVRPSHSLLLAERDGSYLVGVDTHISIEAIGERIRVHIDGEPAFDVQNSSRVAGTIALYTADNAGARFTDIRVDDLRRTAPVVYRFKFTTSSFADFRHHLHSFPDRVFRTPLADLTPLAAAAAVAVDPAAAPAPIPSEAEARAYDVVASAAFGSAARQPTAAVEITRLLSGPATAAILVRSGEPIDWRRSSLVLSTTAAATLDPVPAGAAKIIDAGFAGGGAPNPADEWAAVELNEKRDMSLHVIERRILPSPSAPGIPAGTPLTDANFLTTQTVEQVVKQTLWSPTFGDMSGLSIYVPPGALGVPNWHVAGSKLLQTGNVYVPDLLFPNPAATKPQRGTIALHSADYSDIRVRAHIDIPSSGAAGLVFRYQGSSSHYRYSINRAKNRRYLVKFAGGVFTVLHSSALPLGTGTSQNIVIEAIGHDINVWVDGTLAASATDSSMLSGGVGFYTYGNAMAQFSAVSVEGLARRIGDWRVDDIAPTGERGVWRIAYGVLSKDASTASPAPPGMSFAVLATGTWSDLKITTVVSPTSAIAGAIGVVWRYVSTDTHMRIAIDHVAGSATVIRRNGAIDTVLATSVLPPAGVTPARKLVIEAVGHRLRISMDDSLLFELTDAGLGAGTVGAFADHDLSMDVMPFEIVHAAPTWEPWYVFGGEDPHVSGRRFRIAASSQPGGYVTPAGEEARWKNQAAAGFKPAFPAEGIDLRLLDPAGTVLHMRRFRPDAAYASMPGRLVRSQDGTGFLMLPQAATLPNGEIRLEFVFRRNNQAMDPDSLILSQEGETTSETARISIV